MLKVNLGLWLRLSHLVGLALVLVEKEVELLPIFGRIVAAAEACPRSGEIC